MTTTLKSIFLCMFLFSLYRFVPVTVEQLLYPHDLAYETQMSVATIQAIQTGKNIYDPACYEQIPYQLCIYTPLYFYLSALIPDFGVSVYLPGRLLTLICYLLLGVLMFRYFQKSQPYLSLFSLALLFIFRPVIFEGAYVKNDSLPLLLSFVCLLLGTLPPARPIHLYGSALAALLAFLSKQYFISAPLACLLFLWIHSRSMAWLYLRTLILSFLAGGLACHLLFGPGFWISVFRGPGAHFNLLPIFKLWAFVLREPVFLCLCVTALFFLIRTIKQKQYALLKSPFLIYLVFNFLILCGISGNPGGVRNYFLEFHLSLILWVLTCLRQEGLKGPLVNRIVSLLMLCFCLEMATAPLSTYTHLTPENKIKMTSALEEQKAQIRTLKPQDTPPLLLSLVWPQFAYELPVTPVLTDPYVYQLMWNGFILDVNPVIRDVMDHRFDMVILPPDLHSFLSSPPASPADYLIRAITVCYKKSFSGRFSYWVPKD